MKKEELIKHVQEVTDGCEVYVWDIKHNRHKDFQIVHMSFDEDWKKDGCEPFSAILVDAITEASAQWQQEYDDCRAILRELVELKLVKDAHGKTEEYIERKEKAWQKAIKFLEQYQHQ